MKYISTLIFLFSVLNLNSQEIGFNWVNQIEGSYNEIITSQIDENNNIYVSGVFNGGLFDDVNGSITFNGITNNSITFLEMDGAFLAKYSNLGELEWAIPIYELFAGAVINIFSLKIDSNGNLYVAGRYSGTIVFDYDAQNIELSSTDSSYDSFIAKFDNDGNFLWVEEIKGNNNDNIVSLSISEDNLSIYATGNFNQNAIFGDGSTQLNSNGFSDVFIAKYNSTGEHQWAKGFGGSTFDYAMEILTTINNDFYALGSFSGSINIGNDTNPFPLTSNAFRDNYIVKFNQDGEPLWAKQIENDVEIEEGIIDNNGNILIVGSFSGNQDFDPDTTVYEIQSNGNQNDAFLLKLNPNGNFEWVTSFGGDNSDLGKSLAIDEDENIFIGGIYSGTFDYSIGTEVFNVSSSDGSYDCYILKLDSSGSPTNLITFGGEDTDYLNAIETKNNSLYAFGRFRETVDFDPTDNVFTITNSNSDSNSYILSLISDTSLSVLNNSFVEKEIRVYPNPTNNLLNVVFDEQNYGFPIRIILRNSLGQVVQNQLLNDSFMNPNYLISVDGNSGIYFLELYENTKLIKSIKIIKK